MKPKLFNVLTVCLVALAVISPGLVVLSLVWEKHTEFVRTQKLNPEISKIIPINSQPSSDHKSSLSQIVTPQPPHQNMNQVVTITDTYKLAIIIQWFIVLIPIFVGLGIIIHDRYILHRASILKEQVEMLERLWQQSIEQ
ncbi:hypothetical protein CLI64_25310 [Nostoc sp. CENA543]|uniref:hypothetical protein n=1 Tax=Nostoc sp. CENA543 TaxID=1869241 RepID=UPI000CA1F25A|nr:hypothetical protein [Nostoc sp. CENA543]AUT03461.1 hypothetical protein CLI64_25310 [Nostoc sp. CENA543]